MPLLQARDREVSPVHAESDIVDEQLVQLLRPPDGHVEQEHSAYLHRPAALGSRLVVPSLVPGDPRVVFSVERVVSVSSCGRQLSDARQSLWRVSLTDCRPKTS